MGHQEKQHPNFLVRMLFFYPRLRSDLEAKEERYGKEFVA
jgi:hypothetical protein